MKPHIINNNILKTQTVVIRKEIMVEFVPDKFRITKKNIKIVYYNNEIEKFSVYRPRLFDISDFISGSSKI